MRNHKLLPLLLFVVILGFSIPSYAQFGQPDSKQSDNEFKMSKRLFIGGGLGFGMSSYSTSLWIAPEVGYRISPSFDIGLRFTYNYYHYNDDLVKFSTNNYGSSLFARYYLFFFNDLFLHAEYEVLSYEYGNYVNLNGDVETTREWVSGLFLGGGYRQWIGSNAFIGITILWNVLDDINSPYSNPIFRIGVGVGI